MKYTVLCATAALAVTATAASAADLAVEVVEPPVYVAEAFNWTGFYAGVHGGFGGDQFDYPFEFNGTSGEASITSSGFFAGGQIGANWQFYNSWVLGAVADIAWADIDGEVELDVDGLDIRAGSTVNWFGTVRGRIGFTPTERLLLYGTGGFAYGEVESNLDINVLGVSESISDTQTGWTAGGGFEYAVTDNITLFTEYLYVDLGDQELFDDGDFSLEAETQFHTIKAGLNFLW